MSAIEQVRQRAAERKELADYRRREAEMNQAQRDQDMFAAGQDDAYTAVERELMRRQGPIVTGSPEDRQMQANMERGYNYAVNQEPLGAGMFDDFKAAVSRKLNSAGEAISSGLADMFGPSEAEMIRDQRNTQMGQELLEDMRASARTNAFARAQQMGDMSEDNINRLMVEEMKNIEGGM